uniref:FAD/NAD(P)-binding domain-containing protein n=1 Tax=Helicotheca tamesis TaxID=374047 RepID=A0A7S2N4A5_9STRA|mmetsp:Transcript_9157/g.12726  ORF Transcript_9157/g.12726 Transcript_9157/m.12726 type:complete len:460 (+) Transcript_9157:79-1458(+)|eukprot:CAMPEP_0185736688 /NCGR_PEP_ID=MMETSP1171-20130828/28533_1 /TAXON_ID=374046 /ORGANISM="Helicotheca tamensis, Strain CCMP826" /LENGTH=459 /DNA_ID=CAMNT_0028407385 /DNA_START=31 /DNA_END=1410 /DNA_ORIENTATION=-
MGCQQSSIDEPHQVVIVGASFGGNGVIKGLLDEHDGESLPPTLHVTMLDEKEDFAISATNQFVWSNRLSSTDNQVPSWPLSKLIAQKVAHSFRTGEAGTVMELDWEGKQLKMKDGSSVKWDTLVLSPGVVSDPSSIPGLEESSAIDVAAKKDVESMKKEVKVLSNGPWVPKRVALIAVTRMPYKCPPLPFELASLLHNVLEKAGEDVRSGVRIILSVPGEFPFGGPPIKEKFCALLKEMNIEFWTNHVIKSVEHEEVSDNDGDSVTASDVEDSHTGSFTINFEVGEEKEEKSLEADVFFCTFPQRAPDFVQKAEVCNKIGLIPVDLQTNSIEGRENAYAIGDACHTVFPKPNKPHPKAGEFAYLMGLQVAKQIMAQQKGEPGPEPQKRKGKCVAEVGIKGNGVNVEPDFSSVLANPQEEAPKFNFSEVGGAASAKEVWVNSYLERFYGKENYETFVVDE